MAYAFGRKRAGRQRSGREIAVPEAPELLGSQKCLQVAGCGVANRPERIGWVGYGTRQRRQLHALVRGQGLRIT